LTGPRWLLGLVLATLGLAPGCNCGIPVQTTPESADAAVQGVDGFDDDAIHVGGDAIVPDLRDVTAP
jgi:hypothetical protein